MVASNSGRPGGATYDSFKKIFNFYSIHSNHTTQEEDIISNLISMLIYDENKKYVKMVVGEQQNLILMCVVIM